MRTRVWRGCTCSYVLAGITYSCSRLDVNAKDNASPHTNPLPDRGETRVPRERTTSLGLLLQDINHEVRWQKLNR